MSIYYLDPPPPNGHSHDNLSQTTHFVQQQCNNMMRKGRQPTMVTPPPSGGVAHASKQVDCGVIDLCTPPDVIDLCSSSSSSSCSSDSLGETLVFVTKDNATDEWDGNLFRRSELYHDCTGSSDDFSTCSSDPWIMEILQRR